MTTHSSILAWRTPWTIPWGHKETQLSNCYWTQTVQYSGLENSMDCISHGVTKSQTRLSDFHFLFWGFPAGSDSKESGAVGNTQVWSWILLCAKLPNKSLRKVALSTNLRTSQVACLVKKPPLSHPVCGNSWPPWKSNPASNSEPHL